MMEKEMLVPVFSFLYNTKRMLVTSISSFPTMYSSLIKTYLWVPQPSSVVRCLAPNTGVLGSNLTGFSEFFVGVSLGKTLQSPSLVLVKPRKDMNNVSCHCDMTEILLKAG